jgi:hypothetical protein
MARYTKKDADGRYYIESVNGKLESDKFGHTYGEAIDRFAELENADVAPRAEVERLQEDVERLQEINNRHIENIRLAKQEVAREIFEEIERLITKECLVFKDENGIRGYVDASVHYAIAELKKKYTEGE